MPSNIELLFRDYGTILLLFYTRSIVSQRAIRDRARDQRGVAVSGGRVGRDGKALRLRSLLAAFPVTWRVARYAAIAGTVALIVL